MLIRLLLLFFGVRRGWSEDWVLEAAVAVAATGGNGVDVLSTVLLVEELGNARIVSGVET